MSNSHQFSYILFRYPSQFSYNKKIIYTTQYIFHTQDPRTFSFPLNTKHQEHNITSWRFWHSSDLQNTIVHEVRGNVSRLKTVFVVPSNIIYYINTPRVTITFKRAQMWGRMGGVHVEKRYCVVNIWSRCKYFGRVCTTKGARIKRMLRKNFIYLYVYIIIGLDVFLMNSNWIINLILYGYRILTTFNLVLVYFLINKIRLNDNYLNCVRNKYNEVKGHAYFHRSRLSSICF